MNQRFNMEVPVLIIGTGPSGATTALLLARMGIKSMVVSKHKSTANTPRAHIFNQRAMEVLRDAGLEPKFRDLATPADGKQDALLPLPCLHCCGHLLNNK